MDARTTSLRTYSLPAAGWAILGGFLGTLAFTILMYAAPTMGLPPMDLPTLLGTMFTTNMSLAFALGLVMHFLIGSVILALVYSLFVADVLPGPSWLRGVTYGVAVWLVAMAVVMPMIGAVHPLVASGMMPAPGFFVSSMGPMAAIGSLIGHLAYGAILGAVRGVRGAPVIVVPR